MTTPPTHTPTHTLPDELKVGHAGQGAAVQMLARGPQNRYTDLDPQMSHWITSYKRHTNFAVETVEHVFPLGLQFGKTVRLTVPATGDLLGDLWLQLRLPALVDVDGGGAYPGSWVPQIGRVLFRRMRFIINDTVVHDQERLWYDLSDKLFQAVAHDAAMTEMLGGATQLPAGVAQMLFVPMKFLFCKAHRARQQYLPLLTLSGAAISVELEVEALGACLRPGGGGSTPLDPGDWGAGCRLMYDAVFLDKAERSSLLARPVVMMYEDVQDMEQLNYRIDDRANGNDISIPVINVDLRELNHPVRALVFVAYKDPPGNTFFDYLDAVEEASLLVGSAERFSPQPGGYFSLVQPYQACRRAQADNVHVYSFALDLTSDQPCGSVNFASLDRPFLKVRLRPGLGDLKVKVFAMCLKWLKCSRGDAANLFN